MTKCMGWSFSFHGKIMSELGKEIIDGLTDAIQFMEGQTKGAKVHQPKEKHTKHNLHDGA